MKLTARQKDLLLYLEACNWASPRTIRKIKGIRRGTIDALERRGLVDVGYVNGFERVYISSGGRVEAGLHGRDGVGYPDP